MNITAIKLLILSCIAILFIGCGEGLSGGDANGNGASNNSLLAITAKSFSSTATDGNVTLEISNQDITNISIEVKDIKLIADNYNIVITSISPSTVTFNGSNLTKTIQITFTYIGALGSSDISLNDIKLKYLKTVFSNLTDTHTSTNELVENIKLGSLPTNGNSTGSANNLLELIPYAPQTTINKANESITITLQVNDLNSSLPKPAVNEKINIIPIGPEDGNLDSFSKTTDSNGRVTFTYTSSDSPKYGTQLDLTIYSDKYPNIKKVLTLNFTAQNTSVVSNMYIAPSRFTISKGDETKTIKIVTVDNQNIGVSTGLTIEQPFNGDGNNYGSFNVSSLTTDSSGSASLTYTAPSDITNLHDRNITITENSANLKRTLQIHFASSTSDDTNATAYEINTVIPNSVPLDSKGAFVINIQKIGNTGEIITNTDVKDVNVSTHFAQQLTITDTNYNDAGVKTINFKTHSLSGTVIVDISAKIFDGTKDVNLKTSIPITIFSGPVAAVSLFYVSTVHDDDLGTFKDKYTIHAVDKYSNPVNSGVQLYPTLINGFKTISHNGEISNNGNTVFQDSTASFTTDVSLSDDDHLIILPSSNGFNKSYLGGWTINSINDNHHLTLTEDYNGMDTASLRYIIGNKNRLIADDIVTLADIQSTTGSYLTDENGNVQFIVTYDPMLVGHTLSLSAVAYDKDNNRSGISLRTNFRGKGYSYSAQNVANDGATHTSTISISILPIGSGPLANVNIVPASVFVTPENMCDINTSASNFTTNNNGEFTVSINTQGTSSDSDPKTCTVSWIPKNSSIYYEY
jgi:hypothetical protein